jgi:uncharacterized membrane protein YfcA
VTLGPGGLALAGAATLVAGGINAIAGGGTLISFPTLVALGVPSLPANVTNTVALCPGYLSGAHAQRTELRHRRRALRRTLWPGALGGLAGSALLQVTPESSFRAAVPWLILLSCALLISQDRMRGWLRTREATRQGANGAEEAAAGAGPGAGGGGGGTAAGVSAGSRSAGVASPAPETAVEPDVGWVAMLAVFGAAVYGGFFGAGLGIMMLAILGLLGDDDLKHSNAIKQALSLVINVVAAAFFAVTGHVRWELVPVMAVAALIGGNLGGRLARVVNPVWLRRVVVLFGIGVAVQFWVG